MNALRHAFHHVRDSKVFYCDMLILFSILLRHLEMMVTALTIDLQMGLGYILCSFTLAMRAILTTAHGALFASQSSLRGAIEAGVRDRVTLAIGQERLKSHINTDIKMLTPGWFMLGMWLRLTDDMHIPMPISPMNQVYRLRQFPRQDGAT